MVFGQYLPIESVGQKSVPVHCLFHRHDVPKTFLRRLFVQSHQQNADSAGVDARQSEYIRQGRSDPLAVPNASRHPLCSRGFLTFQQIEHGSVVSGALQI